MLDFKIEAHNPSLLANLHSENNLLFFFVFHPNILNLQWIGG